ncbi:MAG: archaeal proteasome endopeptidase complex subunit beta [Candidatus Aenigmarchaeota archaeon]|nr:archaeal proteasome endopeptidase complex subunit beta [Candidatus Aenigmarchaeota archaeon]
MENDYEIKPVKTGTTTVGLVSKDAVILGADRKATMGYLIASKTAKKILQIDDHIGMTIAGLVGDAQALERYIKAELKLYKLSEDRKISISAAAYLVANILYGRRFYPYYVQLIVGGYDDKAKLYSLGADGSVMEEAKYYSSGSGSPMAFGVLEHGFKRNMSTEEAKKLVVRSVRSALRRDIGSGSGIDVVVIDSKGFRRIDDDEIKKLGK